MLGSIFHRQAVRKLFLVESQKNFHKQLKIPLISYRARHAAVDETEELSNKATNNYQMIYKFPYIVQSRAVCRLKVYQTAITSVAVPVVGYLNHIGAVDTQAFLGTLAIGGFATVMLYVMGEIFRRLVGIIYYSPSENSVKISHLSFWGKRKDIYVPLEDIVPLTDIGESPTDLYVKLLRYSKPKSELFFSLRFGGILDIEKFEEVFGRLNPEEQLHE